MIIITKNKIIKWNYKRGLKNLLMLVGIILFTIGYFTLSNWEFIELINR